MTSASSLNGWLCPRSWKSVFSTLFYEYDGHFAKGCHHVMLISGYRPLSRDEGMNKKLVVWGASSHALVVADVIRLQGDYEIVGFLDSINPERVGTEFCGASILGGEEQLDVLLQQGVAYLIVGIGS